MRAIMDAMIAALAEDHPMTVRQVFYRLVSSGVIAKSEAEYKSTVVRLLGVMRRSGEIPFGWIADNTRWMRKPVTYSSFDSMLEHSVRTYRRSVWDSQDCYVEIWLEKDALAGVLMEETTKWDVPLMVTRGYPSLTFLHSAAEQIRHVGKPTHLYYFGDYDPSGLDITRAVEDGIREFAPEVEMTFDRVAVTAFQISALGLPTRPTKATDSRSRNFEGESVEVDAIPPRLLRGMVADRIEWRIDAAALERCREIEAAERDTLKVIADWWKDDTGQVLTKGPAS